MLPIELTYKDSETEETLDIYFYRPLGYILARSAKVLGITPNAITIGSLFAGLAAGFLFYSNSLKLTIAGIFFFIIYETLDSADGQLARLLSIHTEFGRILDGLVGDIVFFNLYLGLCFRFITGGGSFWIIPLAVAAGVSNSFQAAMADYYRNCYLYFVRGSKSSELDSSSAVRLKYQELRWRKKPIQKLFSNIYLTYTMQQELLSMPFIKLKLYANSIYGDNFPPYLIDGYRELNRPMIKFYNILTVNTRLFALFVFLLLGMPQFYFIFELVILNILFAYVLSKQNRIFQSLRDKITSTEAA
jgi:phosphatidylglycerophosphate synthase